MGGADGEIAWKAPKTPRPFGLICISNWDKFFAVSLLILNLNLRGNLENVWKKKLRWLFIEEKSTNNLTRL